MAYVMCVGLLLCVFGSTMAVIGTVLWTHVPVVPVRGIVTAHWDVRSSSGLGVACTSRIELMGLSDQPPTVGVSVNVTEVGPCFAGAVGTVLDMCHPRKHPELAELGGCDGAPWSVLMAGCTVFNFGIALLAWIGICIKYEAEEDALLHFGPASA